ncbi:hypothetical protein SDC9_181364 [bioreactor metagenome]|uniref:Uncharacterized protein n=1 Tax=bioreactor metagenome TaxID=1076179 RepID=A0A645H6A0_9ZZZZ
MGAQEVVEVHIAPDPATPVVEDDQGGEVTDAPGALFLKEVSADHSVGYRDDEGLGHDVSRTLAKKLADEQVIGN